MKLFPLLLLILFGLFLYGAVLQAKSYMYYEDMKACREKGGKLYLEGGKVVVNGIRIEAQSPFCLVEQK